MAVYLGIDTSNYTTSAAAFDDVSGCVFQKKILLPVKSGERGLRQSDAVFHHTQQLWQVVSAVIDECGKPDFIGASYAPRDAEGSYMPCFTVGLNTAKCLSSALGVPLYEFRRVMSRRLSIRAGILNFLTASLSRSMSPAERPRRF